MSPKQKAIELQDKFRIKAGSHAGDEGEVVNDYLVAKHIAKKAAIICVDEIIQELEPDDLFKNYNERVTYWRDVKEEISKL